MLSDPDYSRISLSMISDDVAVRIVVAVLWGHPLGKDLPTTILITVLLTRMDI